MKASDFRSADAGQIVQTINGHAAFVPAPLPPILTYDNAMVLALSQADAALGELEGLGRNLPSPRLLIAPYVRREAVLSSRIEGTRATLSDLYRDELEDDATHAVDADVREVRNYVDALEHGVSRLKDLPLSLRLVREMHAILLRGVRGEQMRPGEFRHNQNWIGPAGSAIENATYVPPPPDVLIETLGKWEQFINVRSELPDLVQCALMHEQFEAIHPFLDGNGRIGRLLITLFLLERGRLSAPLLYLSAFIEAHRQDYYDLLQRVRTDGDWPSWLRFFLTGVTETSRAAVRQASQLMELREEFRERLRETPKAVALLDELFINPYITAARAMQVLHVSDPSARNAVSVLRAAGMLDEITGRSWRRIYAASPILRILSTERSDDITK